MKQAKRSGRFSSLPAKFTRQLFLSHLLVALLTLGIYTLLNDIFISGTLVFVMTLEFAGMVGSIGILINLNLIRGVRKVESAVGHLSRTQPIPPQFKLATWIWPFSPIIIVLVSLQEQILRPQPQEYSSHDDHDKKPGSSHQFRPDEQWLRQVSQAAAQAERNRLARDLHDSIKQQIFTIVVSAAAVQARFEKDPQGAKNALENLRRSAREAQVEMNALLGQLRPDPLENGI